jgi:FkbM family methyltransferase
MNIVDVGAGKYKKYEKWLSKFPALKVYAIEPHPENFKKLEKLKNDLLPNSSKRLILFQCAISDTSGRSQFHVNNDSSSGSLLELDQESVKRWRYPIGRRFLKTIKKIYVDVVTLSSIFEKHKINSVELLNIDTQGDSLSVLNSLSAKQFFCIKQILVKAHSPGCTLYKNQCESYDVVRFLKRRYFQLFKTLDYSHCQEQLLNFINEPMKNRGAPLNRFVE